MPSHRRLAHWPGQLCALKHGEYADILIASPIHTISRSRHRPHRPHTHLKVPRAITTQRAPVRAPRRAPRDWPCHPPTLRSGKPSQRSGGPRTTSHARQPAHPRLVCRRPLRSHRQWARACTPHPQRPLDALSFPRSPSQLSRPLHRARPTRVKTRQLRRATGALYACSTPSSTCRCAPRPPATLARTSALPEFRRPLTLESTVLSANVSHIFHVLAVY